MEGNMAVEGLDPEEFTQLVNAFGSAVTEVSSLAATATARIQSCPWNGPDADEFRSDWTALVQPQLSKLVTGLAQAQQHLQAELAQQTQASTVLADGATILKYGDNIVGGIIDGTLAAQGYAIYYEDIATAEKSLGGSLLRQGGDVGKAGHDLMDEGKADAQFGEDIDALSGDDSILGNMVDIATKFQVGPVLMVGSAIFTSWQYWDDDHSDSDFVRGEKAALVGGASAAGGWAGAEAGAETGALIGSLIGPEGTVVGAIAGGVVGGIVGSEVGKDVGKTLANQVKVVDQMVGTGVSDVSHGASSAVRDITNWF